MKSAEMKCYVGGNSNFQKKAVLYGYFQSFRIIAQMPVTLK